MKVNFSFPLLVIMIISFSACNNKPADNRGVAANSSEKKPYSPIEGNWELVSNVKWGQKIDPKRPQQFKIFNEGYFCFMMYDSLGNFYGAGAGPYEIKGNVYKETLTYYSNPKWIGSTGWQEWEMKGDTLIFYGFKKATMPDGRDVTDEWGRDKFVEKRIKAKKQEPTVDK